MKNIVLINDISGVGKCSLMASIPIFSHFEIEANPIITAILSNQTAYDNFSFFDFTPYMQEYIDVWEKEKRSFNMIYTGFLGSLNQIKIIKNFILNHKEAFIVVDPVMGDNEEIYTTYTKEMCEEIRCLVECADLVTPNITEGKILTNRRLDMKVDIEEGMKICKEISNLGAKKVVLTGIILKNKIINMAYEKKIDKYFIVEEKYYPYSFGGTGDLFTSILTALIGRGKSLEEALKISSKFIGESIENTIKEPFDTKEGIKFEKILKGVKVNE